MNKYLEHIKKNTLNYAAALLGILLSYFFLKKYFIYILITAGIAVFNYYHDRFNKSIFDLKLTLVVGIIIASYYQLIFSVIFLIATNVLPTLLGGGRINLQMIIFNVEFLGIFAVAGLIPDPNMMMLGIILIIVDAVLGVVINTMLGVNRAAALTSASVSALIRVAYLLTIGRLIEFIFNLASVAHV